MKIEESVKKLYLILGISDILLTIGFIVFMFVNYQEWNIRVMAIFVCSFFLVLGFVLMKLFQKRVRKLLDDYHFDDEEIQES